MALIFAVILYILISTLSGLPSSAYRVKALVIAVALPLVAGIITIPIAMLIPTETSVGLYATVGIAACVSVAVLWAALRYWVRMTSAASAKVTGIYFCFLVVGNLLEELFL